MEAINKLAKNGLVHDDYIWGKNLETVNLYLKLKSAKSSIDFFFTPRKKLTIYFGKFFPPL